MKLNFMDRARDTARALCIASLTVPVGAPAFAGDHWLSGVQGPSGGQGVLNASSSKSVFNIVISLEADPQGDDDATADAGTTDDAQQVYEEKIKAFADAVFQMTNGAHKLGRVTIYRNNDQKSRADITWKENCTSNMGPRANPNGMGRVGKHIWMCTNWSGAASLIPTAAGAGAVLAHEWGHYAYGLFDEYQANQCTISSMNACVGRPTATDTAVSPSIMNCQWFAVGGGCTATSYSGAAGDFYEFSTPNLAPYTATSTGSTAHKRVFNESGWDTLARSTDTDPFWQFLFKAKRTHYTNLTAPTAPNYIVRDAVGTAQSDLDIRWTTNTVVELMIDRSGSMTGTPIANAKSAAALLVDQLVPGQNAIGVGSFNSASAQDFAIADIPKPDTGIRTSVKQAIAAINAGGGTNVNGGLQTALAQTIAFDPARPAVVYLLSDGVGGTSNRQPVIDAYNQAGVTIVAFAYGTNSDEAALRDYANQTGGAFFQSPTTLAEIQAAFVSANAAFSSSVAVTSSATSVAANGNGSIDIPIDSTLGTALISLSYQGTSADLNPVLVRPNGAPVGGAFACTGSGTISCTLDLDEAAIAAGGAGTYQVRLTNATAAPIDVSTLVSGTPAAGSVAYDVVVEFEDAAYPAPMIVRATVRQDAPLSGLTVTAKLTDPTSAETQLTLLDDGVGSDNIADDGTYSASIAYRSSGNYNITVDVSNPNGTAQTTFNGLSLAVGVDGAVSDPVPQDVTEQFTRFAAATAQAVGVQADDHADTPNLPASCTVISDDNMATDGRIDAAGDVDCFLFTPTSTSDPLVVRGTGLTDGLMPIIRVYDASGTTELATVDLATSEAPDSGAVFTVPANVLDAAGHVVTVESADATAAVGSYGASVGKALASDMATSAGNPAVPSGGAMDRWALLMLALLAMGGLFLRRRDT